MRQIMYNIPLEDYQYKNGVALSVEGRTIHIITDRSHPQGRKHYKLVDPKSARTLFNKLVLESKRN